MWQNLLRESSFFLLLLNFDQDLAEEVRARGCPYCAGRLHGGGYQRKPRGAPADLPPEYERRESFCCSVCRKRVLPPSLRFFGRRVYLGPVFVVVSAMIHGISEKRAAALRELVGVSIRTLARWRTWWRKSFPGTAFWKAARARFAAPPDHQRLPASLLERFDQSEEGRGLFAALKFLLPLSGGSHWAMGR